MGYIKTLAAILSAVGRQSRFLWIIICVQIAVAGVCSLVIRDASFVRVALQWGAVALAAIFSFVIHEFGHAVVILGGTGVKGVGIERRAYRLSLHPHGTMSGYRIAAAALTGPLACVASALLFVVLVPSSPLSWIYAAHALSLLPIFGDGRSLVRGLHNGRRLVALNPQPEMSHQ